MKLTEIQHKNIINYLINEGLEYKEFIDEMTDHFINSIEAKMGEGQIFAQALRSTEKAFEGEVYRSFIFDPLPARGLAALEKKYFRSKFKDVRLQFNKLIKTEWVYFALLLVIGLLVVRTYDNFGSLSYLSYILYGFMALLYVGIYWYINYKSDGYPFRRNSILWVFTTKQSRVRKVECDLFLKLITPTTRGVFSVLLIVFISAIKEWFLTDEVLIFVIVWSAFSVFVFFNLLILQMISQNKNGLI